MNVTPALIRSISEGVYRRSLAADAGNGEAYPGGTAKWRADAAQRQIDKDGDGGKKFSGRAAAYDRTVGHALDVLAEMGLLK